MFAFLRKRIRVIASFLLFIFFQSQALEVYALTSGPAQEEFASFEPVGTTEMVDLYSGDFTYNIPLLSVPGPNGGYPINLAYHSGVGMDQEASWVGLGWNVNVGAINRSLRGLPDDFKGDEVVQKKHIKTSWSVGVDLNFDGTREVFGFPMGAADLNTGITTQVYYNNYKGLGYRFKYQPRIVSKQDGGSSPFPLGLSFDSQSGIGIDVSFSGLIPILKNLSLQVGVNGSINSRQGLSLGYSSNVGIGVQDYYYIARKNHLDEIEYDKFENGTTSFSVGGGVSYSFNGGVPTSNVPMSGVTETFDVKLGFGGGVGPVGVMRSNFPRYWTGFVSSSGVANDGNLISNGYGYLYTGDAPLAGKKAMMDYSHAHVPYTRKLPMVPPSTVNHDIFSVSGQGTGGAFRVYRNDVGVYSSRESESKNKYVSVNFEAGETTGIISPMCATWYHIGLGTIPLGNEKTTSGAWHSGAEDLLGKLKFTNASNNTLKESAYFKQIGDAGAMKHSASAHQYDVWRGEEAVAINLKTVGSKFLTDGLIGQNGAVDIDATNLSTQNDRQSRNNVIQKLTAAEAKQYGMSKNLVYYVEGGNPEGISKFPSQGNTANVKDHHISEIVQLQADGTRYIYGLPTYNKTHEDASFSVAKGDANAFEKKLIDVPADPGYPNPAGSFLYTRHEKFLDKTNLPPYVNSWMLTGVVSADYVDLTGDGITDDDYGYWVKFEYKRTADDYHWRIPYSKASYSPGTADQYDDKGSYSKGTKELYYLYRIKTKTHVAVFEISDRNDGCGADIANRNGGLNNPNSGNKMKKLDKIKLFTIKEYEDGEADEPLKVVNLSYKSATEELCQLIPNRINPGAGGKLTLDKVYFTYGKSTKGSLSPYKFHYSEANPSYSEINYDCWGNYKNNAAYGQNYPFTQFPYTEQDFSRLHNPNAWHLTKIDLPTGGRISVEYEHDDYAYIEDKKAMQMYDIVHVGDNIPANIPPQALPVRGNYNNGVPFLGDLGNANAQQNGYRIYFKLKNSIPVTTPNPAEWFRTHYLEGINDVFYKAQINLKNSNDHNSIGADFVSGYTEINKNAGFGVARSIANSSNFDLGFIQLQPKTINSATAGTQILHPFRDAAFEHLKNNRSELVFGGNMAVDPQAMFSWIPDIMNLILGYKSAFKTSNFARNIHLSGHSVIRLLVPDGKKYGGGVRVKRVKISDEWKNMTGGTPNSANSNETYGQVYDYTTVNEAGESISSGVAYEPYIGKEQSAIVTPVKYEHSNLLQAPQHLFLENPIMMQHYPGPSVGYSKVKISSITSENTNVTRPTAAVSVYEYYTPKDFPIIFRKTNPIVKPPRVIPISLPLYTQLYKRMAISQGYSLIMNNMAGKPKVITHLTKQGTVIAKQEFEYFTKTVNGKKELNNEVPVFTGDMVYELARIGTEYDINVSMHEDRTKRVTVMTDLNLEGGILPACVPIPIPIPITTNLETSLKTAVVQKVIQKQGILKSVKVTDGQSVVITENLVFDELSGEPLLTRVTNEFHDKIYNYAQKARWFYDGMDAAFKNIGASIVNNGTGGPGTTAPTLVDASKGLYNVPNQFNVNDWFVEGDEVWLKSAEGDKKAHVVGKITAPTGTNQISLMYLDGTYVKATYLQELTIIRSGRRNLLNVNAGAIAAMNMTVEENPQAGTTETLNLSAPGTKILNASAVKFRDYWPTENCYIERVCEDNTVCVPASSTASNAIGDMQVFIDGAPVTNFASVGVCTSGTVPYTLCTNTQKSYTVKVNGVAVPYTVTGECTFNAGTCEYALCIPGIEASDYYSGCYSGSSPYTNDYRIYVDGNAIPASSIEPLGISDCEFGIDEVSYEIPFSAWPGTHVNQQGIVVYGNSHNMRHKILLGGNSINGSVGWPSGYASLTSMQHLVGALNSQNYLNSPSPSPTSTCNSSAYWWYTEDISAQKWTLHHKSAPPAMGFVISVYSNTTTFHDFVLRAQNRPTINVFPDLTSYTEYLAPPIHTRKGFGGVLIKNLAPGVPHEIGVTRSVIHPQTYQSWYAAWQGHPSIPSGGGYPCPINPSGFCSNDISIYRNIIPACNGNITADKVTINLPIGVQSNIQIFENGNPTPVNTATVTPAAGDIIRLPDMTVGNHQVLIKRENQTMLDVSLGCDAEDANSYVTNCGINGSNPYTSGTKGNWRAWMAFSYVTDRVYNNLTNRNDLNGSANNQNTNAQNTKGIREEGYFADFVPFKWGEANNPKWKTTSRVTKFSPYGFELENVDALGIYAAAHYDYDNNLLTALASNARYQEIAFDGFETYPKAKNCESPFYFENVVLENIKVHSGNASLKVSGGTTWSNNLIALFDDAGCAAALAAKGYSQADVLNFLTKGEELTSSNIPKMFRTTTEDAAELSEPLPKECTCLGRFSPISSKPYHLNVWVKEDLALSNLVSYSSAMVSVVFLDGADQEIPGSRIDFYPSGKIIEGWQQIKGKFTVPTGAVSVKVGLIDLTKDAVAVFFDDLRIHPADAGMQSYVYNQKDYRIMAELDNNNYATFYIYDEEGSLIKVKKETEDGIKTIQEGRRHTHSSDTQ